MSRNIPTRANDCVFAGLNQPDTLTKREYFAALIMAGFAAQVANGAYDPSRFYKQAAEEAVANAEALITALNKGPKEGT